MACRIRQSAVIMLAVNFHQRFTQTFENLHTHGLIIDQRPRAPVRHLDAA